MSGRLFLPAGFLFRSRFLPFLLTLKMLRKPFNFYRLLLYLFTYIPPENGNDGNVSAVVSVDFKSGSTIKLGLDRTLSYIKEYSVDMNKGGWTGEEFAYDNKFSPDITRFEDETVTEYVEVPVEIKTEKQDDADETVTTTTTIIKKVKKNKSVNNGNLTAIVLISVIAAVVIAGGLAAFAVIRKKKKNAA